jgi:hypothetical protein
MAQLKQKRESGVRTTEIEKRKGKTVDQAPENKRKTEVIEELKRKTEKS